MAIVPEMSVLDDLLNFFGHHSDTCECVINNNCTDNGLLIERHMWKKTLSNWDSWCGKLKWATKKTTCVEKVNVVCIWRSLLSLLALNPNSHSAERKHQFNDLVNLLSQLVKECEEDNYCFMQFLIEDLMLPLFTEKCAGCIIPSGVGLHPFHSIAYICMDSALDKYYQRLSHEGLMELLGPIAAVLLKDTTTFIISFLNKLPRNDCTLKLWMALVENISNRKQKMCIPVIARMLKWPLQSMNAYCDVKLPALKWYNFYNLQTSRLQTNFNKRLALLLKKEAVRSAPSNYFVMFAIIAVIKQYNDLNMLRKLDSLTSLVVEYEDLFIMIPPFTDTIEYMVHYLIKSGSQNKAQLTINCVKYILRVLCKQINLDASNGYQDMYRIPYVMLGNLFNAVTPLYKVDTYTSLIDELTTEVRIQFQTIHKDSNFDQELMDYSACSDTPLNNQVHEAITSFIASRIKTEKNDLSKVLHESSLNDIDVQEETLCCDTQPEEQALSLCPDISQSQKEELIQLDTDECLVTLASNSEPSTSKLEIRNNSHLCQEVVVSIERLTCKNESEDLVQPAKKILKKNPRQNNRTALIKKKTLQGKLRNKVKGSQGRSSHAPTVHGVLLKELSVPLHRVDTSNLNSSLKQTLGRIHISNPVNPNDHTLIRNNNEHEKCTRSKSPLLSLSPIVGTTDGRDVLPKKTRSQVKAGGRAARTTRLLNASNNRRSDDTQSGAINAQNAKTRTGVKRKLHTFDTTGNSNEKVSVKDPARQDYTQQTARKGVANPQHRARSDEIKHQGTTTVSPPVKVARASSSVEFRSSTVAFETPSASTGTAASSADSSSDGNASECPATEGAAKSIGLDPKVDNMPMDLILQMLEKKKVGNSVYELKSIADVLLRKYNTKDLTKVLIKILEKIGDFYS